MHVRYTARDGGLELKEAANLDLTGRLAAIRQGLENTGLHVAISMRRDMPNEWGMLKKTKTTWVTISRDRLPYFARESSGTVESIVFFTVNTAVSLTVDTQVVEINKALVDVELVEVENEIFYSESESDNLAFDSSVKLAIDSQDELDTVQDLLLVVKVKIGV